MDIDWPLAIELAITFVALSLIRYAYFKRRMKRLSARAAKPVDRKKNGTPE